MNTHFQRPDHLHHQQLYVVTTLFNNARYRTRWKHHEDFVKRCQEAGAVVLTVEVGFGERALACDTSLFNECKPNHHVVQLRTTHELWLKEAATNVGVQHLTALYPDWRYVAWVDSDIRFVRDDWADETKHALQHYDLVQMWSQYHDVSPSYENLGGLRSFCDVWRSGDPRPCEYKPDHSVGYPGAPGLAWACTRKAWNTFGGLLDVSILGAGDWYMAHGLVGECAKVVDSRLHPEYRKAIFDWEERALLLRKNIGVVPGIAIHFWHGPKKFRRYATRGEILLNHQFDPTRHTCRDAGGLLQLTPFAPIELRDQARDYFHERNEDAV